MVNVTIFNYDVTGFMTFSRVLTGAKRIWHVISASALTGAEKVESAMTGAEKVESALTGAE